MQQRDAGARERLRPAHVVALLVCLLLAVAACAPPSTALPRLLPVFASCTRAWFYFCSMLLGASPFLACGALAATVSATVSEERLVALFAIVSPGCDCSMNACAPSLRSARPGLAAFALVWGSLCNPLALFATACILGPRMMVCRIVCGCIAATLTALTWARLAWPRAPRVRAKASGLAGIFARSAGAGVMSFAAAAGASAVCLTFFAGATHGVSVIVAAIAGALLSPCSSADALLARVLFVGPAAQLVFLVTAQCLDVRQLALVYRCFGPAHARRAAGAAVVAATIGCLIAGR